ncbi:hypothetical protein HK101_009157 [Irineochytrium annulatum]|nr:hypothetical protein HK101_009157 [Irineochytrium annulatum]
MRHGTRYDPKKLASDMKALNPSTLLNISESAPKLLRSDFFSAQNAEILEQSRYFKVAGFQFCSILNNASFDSLAWMNEWSGPVAAVNPPVKRFIDLLETRAKIMAQVLDKYRAFKTDHTRRLACYCAADGSNSFANLTTSRLLYRVDPVNYFTEVLPSIRPAVPITWQNLSSIPGQRRKYQLAYLLMVDGDASLIENVKALLNNLDDGSAIILIHVDARSPYLRQEVEHLLRERNDALGGFGGPGNVFLTKNSFEGLWGHISLIWIQLNGYFELMDLADWDYVINISAFDFPLRKSREVYRVLNSRKSRGKLWIDHWDDDTATIMRMMRPHLARIDRSLGDFTMYHLEDIGLVFPPFHGWQMCRQHQWMILPRTFVKYLRYSKEVAMMLAYIEFAWIPEQMFFCYVTVNTPYFSSKTVTSNKRFLKYEGDSLHPIQLTIDNARRLIGSDRKGAEPRNLFIRKVDVRSPAGKALVDWVMDEHINHHIQKGSYGKLGGEQWVVTKT